MTTPTASDSNQPKKSKYLSLWLALPLALLVWEGLPWAISLQTPRYGWTEGRPGIWNLLGLIPVIIGTLGLLWGVAVHSAQSPHGIAWELDKSYLLTHGMYAYSRHPMYLSELILLFGWIIFYGSFALIIWFVAWYIFFSYSAMPKEEHILEAHFGESYREYKNRVSRWFGKTHW
jgi:protein-S-isoprenylcysteine O-methyltransferase Ste14